ncbi:MAG TPA: hemerythrin domain-containing protein [Chitinophagaceae bacterium]
MDTQQQTRSRQLSPLSREHVDGMLFVKRIREGIGKYSIDRLNHYTRWYWKNHIRPHFFHEERILLPYMPAGHQWSIKLKEEHAYIRDLVLSLDQDADVQAFKSLCDLIEAHIRFEEQDLFTYLEQTLTKEELDNIHKQLEEKPVDAEEWEDAFWT